MKAVYQLARVEAVRLVRHPVVMLAAVASVVLQVATGWAQMPEWEPLTLSAANASLLLAGGVLVVAYLAGSRNERHGSTDVAGSLPVDPPRQTVGLFGSAVAAALLGAVVVGVHLLTLVPHWPAGLLDYSVLLFAVAIPAGAALIGVALGRWLPGGAAGAAGLLTVATVALAATNYSGLADWRLRWLAPVVQTESWPAAGRLVGGWHLSYLVAGGIMAGAVAVLRHRRRPAPAITLAAATLVAVVSVIGQVRHDAELAGNAGSESLTGPHAYECEQPRDVRYCAPRGHRRWIPLWRAAVEPVVAALPAVARTRLPSVRPRPEQRNARPEPIGSAVYLLSGWGRHSNYAADSRARLATSYAATAAGIPAFDSPAGLSLDGECWGGGRARTVVALWLAAQALPDGAARLQAGRIDLWPVRYGAAEIDAATALLRRPREAVTAALQSRWAELTSATAGVEALTAAGLGPAPPPAPVGQELAACRG